MIQIIDFKLWHLEHLDPQEAQKEGAKSLSPEHQAWTALHDGAPICCAGLVPLWPGRAYAWALLSSDAYKHLFSLTKTIRARLDVVPWQRIEIAVDAGFEAGMRWAEMLGFEHEALCRKLLPNGHDAHVYVRFGNGLNGKNHVQPSGGIVRLRPSERGPVMAQSV